MATQPGATTPMGPQPVFNVLHFKWSWVMVLGMAMLVLGSCAIIFPAVTSVSIELLLGILLLIGAAGRFINMFSSSGWGDFFLRFLGTAIFLAAGVMLLVYPFGGTLTLTLLLAIFFVAEGVARIVTSLMSRERPGWGWMLLNGIVAFALGALIWVELPSSAAWAIGLLVGVYLIFEGWALIMLAWALHSGEREQPAF